MKGILAFLNITLYSLLPEPCLYSHSGKGDDDALETLLQDSVMVGNIWKKELWVPCLRRAAVHSKTFECPRLEDMKVL